MSDDKKQEQKGRKEDAPPSQRTKSVWTAIGGAVVAITVFVLTGGQSKG